MMCIQWTSGRVRPTWWALVAAQTGLLFVLLGALGAQATTPCDQGSGGPYHSVPGDGAVDVPINARVAVWYALATPDEVPVRLIETATGTAVSVTVETVEDSGGVTLFHPVEGLAAHTAYTVEFTHASGEVLAFSSFETGGCEDTTAPAAPKVTGVEQGTTEFEGGEADWVHGHLSISDPDIYHRVEIAKDASFADAEVVTVRSNNGQVSLSSDSCVGEVMTHPHDVNAMRVVAIDMAGNESVRSNTATRLF